MRLFIWVIQNTPSSLQFNYMQSKCMPTPAVEQLLAIVQSINNKQTPKQKVFYRNPNMVALLTPCQESFVPPAFRKHPASHDTGDRVVVLNNTVPGCLLGRMGTVVGINQNMFEVLLDHPQVGATSLGGRCKHFHGLVLEFTDLFNITKQHVNSVFLRDNSGRSSQKGWDGYVEEYVPEDEGTLVKNMKNNAPYQPSGKQPAIPNFNQLTIMNKKKED